MVKVMFLRGVRTRQPLLRGGDSGSPSVTDIFIAGNNAGGRRSLVVSCNSQAALVRLIRYIHEGEYVQLK